MRILKAICSIFTIGFAVLGLTGILEYDISLPVMFVCLGLTNLVTSREYYDKGDKKSAKYFLILSIFIFGVTIINLLGRILL